MRWHYVRKKLPALCGAKIREAILDDILPLLWSGRVDAVIAYLQAILDKKLSPGQSVAKLAGYCERNPDLTAWCAHQNLVLDWVA